MRGLNPELPRGADNSPALLAVALLHPASEVLVSPPKTLRSVCPVREHTVVSYAFNQKRSWPDYQKRSRPRGPANLQDISMSVSGRCLARLVPARLKHFQKDAQKLTSTLCRKFLQAVGRLSTVSPSFQKACRRALRHSLPITSCTIKQFRTVHNIF